ncbi:MAG TPA: Ldh family oxidoreductase [Methanosarcinales archaeon]|nr:Ldh family oxidoreductase [Methanosarcinales archaeon]
MEKVLRFKKEDLFNYAVLYMEKLGIPQKDAEIVADVLIAADLRGVDSHGLIRIYSYYGSRLEKKYMNPLTPFKIISETDTTVLYDGGNGLGQVVSRLAMKKCIEKAKKSNVAIATVKHSNHYGIAGYYAMMALEHGMIGISLTNSQPLVAPTYGRTAVLGTNPISFAAPSYSEYPFVLDMATSVVPIGRIKVYEEKNEKIPVGWGIDDDGNVTEDPKKVQSGGPGALMPLGGIDIMRGYKGYGLALMVEILCAALSGAAHLTDVGFPHEPKVSDVSHFFMAVNIEAFRPLIDFKKQIDNMIKILKDSPKAAGHDRIYIAGEKEFEIAKFNETHGVPLIAPVVEELKANGKRLGVDFELKPL